MHRPWLHLLLLSIIISPLISASKCPRLPPGCKCQMADAQKVHHSYVMCRNEPASRVFRLIEKMELHMLKMHNCSLFSLHQLPNVGPLHTLNLIDCGISSISKNAFWRIAPSIEWLGLDGNRLESLPLKLDSMRKLRKLSLSKNKLTEIPLVPAHLKALYLDSNRICAINRDAMDLQNLELISLSRNCLSSTAGLSNISNLVELDLHDNRINQLGPSAFSRLPKLSRLRLSANGLSHVDPLALTELTGIQTIDLRNNSLSSINISNIGGQLTHLDLRYNKFTQIPQLTKMKKLRQLIIANNKISSISAIELTGAKQLIRLSLENNEIASIEEGAFSDLSNLAVLNLANNHITGITNQFSGLRKLQILSLSGNSISHLDSSVFRDCNQLTSLNLASNNISVLSEGVLPHNVSLIDLSSNNITTISSRLFGVCPSEIFLGGNPLVCDDDVMEFAMWTQNSTTLHDSERADAICAGPPEREGILLSSLPLEIVRHPESYKRLFRNHQQHNTAGWFSWESLFLGMALALLIVLIFLISCDRLSPPSSPFHHLFWHAFEDLTNREHGSLYINRVDYPDFCAPSDAFAHNTIGGVRVSSV